jgi:CheY-like chemotaxis protein
MVTMNPQPIALIVNDDPAQLHIASTILTHDGIGVISCSGAEQALEVLAEGAAVDVIVTDLYMPRMDGWRLCRLLRSDAYRRFNSTPVFGLVLAPSDCPGLEADALALERAVGNLLQNAVQIHSRWRPDHGERGAARQRCGDNGPRYRAGHRCGEDPVIIPKVSLFRDFRTA